MRINFMIFSFLAFSATGIFTSCEKDNPPLKTVEEITVSPEVLSLKTGETALLNAVTVPADGVIVTWSSSASSIAAVDGDGRVFAGGIAGSAVITAFAGGKTATCTVTVTEEEEVVYPLFHAIDIVIDIETTETLPSDKDPAPKHESLIQISGTIIGTAVMGRVEKIVSDPDEWGELAQYGSTPVLIASSELKIRDEQDYSKYSLIRRYPLTVSKVNTEMDYILFEDGEKYTKVYDFVSQGKDLVESINIEILPYFPTILIPPLIPQYVVDLSVLKYVDHISETPEGNGHSLKWDYNTEQLEPTGNPLYLSVMGTYTDIDPETGVKPVLIPRDELNAYFMNPSATGLSLELEGSSIDENYSIRKRTIKVKLNFRPVPSVLAIPLVN